MLFDRVLNRVLGGLERPLLLRLGGPVIADSTEGFEELSRHTHTHTTHSHGCIHQRYPHGGMSEEFQRCGFHLSWGTGYLIFTHFSTFFKGLGSL